MRDSCNEKLQWPKLKYNFAAFLALLSAVNYWRGVWSLLDFYFLPNIPPQVNDDEQTLPHSVDYDNW